MATLADIAIQDLRERGPCIACEGEASERVALPIAVGVDLGLLEDAVPRARLCTACAARQLRAARLGKRYRRLCFVVPPLFPLVLPYVPIAGAYVALALVVAWVLALNVLRFRLEAALARRCAGLIAGGRGRVVRFAFPRPPRDTADEQHPYRTPASTTSLETASTSWVPRAFALRPFVVVAISAVALGIGAGMWNRSYPPMTVTLRGFAGCEILFDGDAVSIPDGTARAIRLRHGTHTATLRCDGVPGPAVPLESLPGIGMACLLDGDTGRASCAPETSSPLALPDDVGSPFRCTRRGAGG